MTDSPEKDETVSSESAEASAESAEASAESADAEAAEASAEAESADAEASEAPEDDADDATDGAEAGTRPAAVEELWRELRVDPVKVALPGGVVGYTLRAYRPASQLTADVAPAEAEDEDDPFEARERQRAAEDALADLGVMVDESEPVPAEADADAEAADAEESADAEAAEEQAEAEQAPETEEEVPVFLSHRGKLLLFGSPESLVSFINSDAPHAMTQLDTWSELVKRVTAADIIPAAEDTYELDLVVENLRGGHDAWDLPLLISAGEFARDIGYALRIKPVINALAAGSPLDDLDEAVRAAETARFGLFARRRIRKFSTTQTSQGWRTVIGKISAAVDWRD
ncbi:MAG TPA: DNA primase [Natronosporangium sp.]